MSDGLKPGEVLAYCGGEACRNTMQRLAAISRDEDDALAASEKALQEAREEAVSAWDGMRKAKNSRDAAALEAASYREALEVQRGYLLGQGHTRLDEAVIRIDAALSRPASEWVERAKKMEKVVELARRITAIYDRGALNLMMGRGFTDEILSRLAVLDAGEKSKDQSSGGHDQRA